MSDTILDVVPEHLPATEVLAVAKHLIEVGRAQRAHWSVWAKLMRRIETEKLYQQEIAWYGTPYETAEEYANVVLDMPRSEFYLFRRLGTLVARDTTLPWEGLDRRHACQLIKIAGLAPIREWVERALVTPYPQWRQRIERLLHPGQESFVKVLFYVPESLVPLLEAKLATALPVVLDQPNPEAELAKDPQIRFRCLEVVLREYGELGQDIVTLTRLLAECYPIVLAGGHDDLAERLAGVVETIASRGPHSGGTPDEPSAPGAADAVEGSAVRGGARREGLPGGAPTVGAPSDNRPGDPGTAAAAVPRRVPYRPVDVSGNGQPDQVHPLQPPIQAEDAPRTAHGDDA